MTIRLTDPEGHLYRLLAMTTRTWGGNVCDSCTLLVNKGHTLGSNSMTLVVCNTRGGATCPISSSCAETKTTIVTVGLLTQRLAPRLPPGLTRTITSSTWRTLLDELNESIIVCVKRGRLQFGLYKGCVCIRISIVTTATCSFGYLTRIFQLVIKGGRRICVTFPSRGLLNSNVLTLPTLCKDSLCYGSNFTIVTRVGKGCVLCRTSNVGLPHLFVRII